jgi:hypothetical protein
MVLCTADSKRVHGTVESHLPRDLEDRTIAIVRRDVEPSKRVAARIINRGLKELLTHSIRTLCTHNGGLPAEAWRFFPDADGLVFNTNGLDFSSLSHSYVIKQLLYRIDVSRPIARFAIDLVAADMDIASSFRLVLWMQRALCAKTLREISINISMSCDAAEDLLGLFPNLHAVSLTVHPPEGSVPDWHPCFPSELRSLSIAANSNDGPDAAPLQLRVASLRKLKQLRSLALVQVHVKRSQELSGLAQLTSLELDPSKMDCTVSQLLETVAQLQELRSLSLPRLLCPVAAWERFCRLQQLQDLQVALLVVGEDDVAAGRELAALRSLRAVRVMMRPAQQQLAAAALQQVQELQQQAQAAQVAAQQLQQQAQQQLQQVAPQQEAPAQQVAQPAALDGPLSEALLEEQRLQLLLLRQDMSLVEEAVLDAQLQEQVEQAELWEAQQWEAQEEEEQWEQVPEEQEEQWEQVPEEEVQVEQGQAQPEAQQEAQAQQQAGPRAALEALMPGLQELQLQQHRGLLQGVSRKSAEQVLQALRGHPSVTSLEVRLARACMRACVRACACCVMHLAA